MNQERLNRLLQFLEENPEDSFLLFAVAKEYEKLGSQGRALSYYEVLIKKDPKYVGTYYHLGKLHEELEQPEKALEVYAHGIEVAKNIKDQHALSELMGAKLNLELDI